LQLFVEVHPAVDDAHDRDSILSNRVEDQMCPHQDTAKPRQRSGSFTTDEREARQLFEFLSIARRRFSAADGLRSAEYEEVRRMSWRALSETKIFRPRSMLLARLVQEVLKIPFRDAARFYIGHSFRDQLLQDAKLLSLLDEISNGGLAHFFRQKLGGGCSFFRGRCHP
jgi:hypothetical protein